MRITKSRLKRIINEEMRRIVREQTVTQGPISIDGEVIQGSEDPEWRDDDGFLDMGEYDIIGDAPRHDQDALLTSFMVDVDFDYTEGTDSEYAQMMQSLGDMWLAHFRAASPAELETIGKQAVEAAENSFARYGWETSDSGWTSAELKAEMVDVTRDALTVAKSEQRPGLAGP